MMVLFFNYFFFFFHSFHYYKCMKRTECCGDEVFSLFHTFMIDSVTIDFDLWNWIQSSEHSYVMLVIEVSLNT